MLGFAEGRMRVQLDNGKVVLADYLRFPRLRNATPTQLSQWRLIAGGVGIQWPELNEDLSTAGLIRDALRIC